MSQQHFRYEGVGPRPSRAATKTVPSNYQQRCQHANPSSKSRNSNAVEDDISDIDAVFLDRKPVASRMINTMNPVVVANNSTPISTVRAAPVAPLTTVLGSRVSGGKQGGGEHQKFSTNPKGIILNKLVTAENDADKLKKPYMESSLEPMDSKPSLASSTLPNTAVKDILSKATDMTDMLNGNPSVASHAKPTSGRKFGERLRITQKQPGLTKSKHQRVFVTHSYTDYIDEKPTADEIRWLCSELKKPMKRQSFLMKLYTALVECDHDNLNHVFYWLPHGRAFMIDNLKKFEEIILPKYFKMDRYTSFLKQCHLYNFQRLTRGSGDASSGSRYHPFFLRGKMFLCRRVKRTKIKGHNIRPAVVFGSEPDLFALKPCVDVNVNQNESRCIERWMHWVASESSSCNDLEFFLNLEQQQQQKVVNDNVIVVKKNHQDDAKPAASQFESVHPIRNSNDILDLAHLNNHHSVDPNSRPAVLSNNNNSNPPPVQYQQQQQQQLMNVIQSSQQRPQFIIQQTHPQQQNIIQQQNTIIQQQHQNHNYVQTSHNQNQNQSPSTIRNIPPHHQQQQQVILQQQQQQSPNNQNQVLRHHQHQASNNNNNLVQQQQQQQQQRVIVQQQQRYPISQQFCILQPPQQQPQFIVQQPQQQQQQPQQVILQIVSAPPQFALQQQARPAVNMNHVQYSQQQQHQQIPLGSSNGIVNYAPAAQQHAQIITIPAGSAPIQTMMIQQQQIITTIPNEYPNVNGNSVQIQMGNNDAKQSGANFVN